VGEALPHPFRDIPFAQRFKKYQHISLEAERHSGDQRPETFRPNVDTLEPGDVVLPKKTWNERKRASSNRSSSTRRATSCRNS